MRDKARKLLPSPPPFLNFCPREGVGPVPGPPRRPWWVGLMAGRGLLRLLGPVQPEPGATLVSVAAAPAASGDGIDWYRGLHRPLFLAASSAVLGALAKDPAAFLPTIATVRRVCPLLTPLTRPLCPFPVTLCRADPSYATGLHQHPFPEKPSVAVALLTVFAFFPIVTEALSRRHPVQTITIVLLPILAPFHQCFSQLALSGQSPPLADAPSISASLRLLLVNHFAHIQNGEFKAAQTKLKRGGGSLFY